MDNRKVKSLQQRIVVVREIARVFVSRQTLSANELKALCSCHIDGNTLFKLKNAGVLKSSRGRNAEYCLVTYSAEVLTNSQYYAERMNSYSQQYTESRREATKKDLCKEIKRLKALLEEHNIQY